MSLSREAAEVLKREPLARYLDSTAANRVMWRKHEYDSPYWIFIDKEPGLLRKPDLLCAWVDLPRHFPAGFFRAALFDPPHTWFGENSLHTNPRSYDENGKYTGMWWGNGGSRNKLIRDIAQGQLALAKVVNGPLLLKWNETSIPLHNILTCFTEWRETHRYKWESKMRRGKSDTWWIRFERKTK